MRKLLFAAAMLASAAACKNNKSKLDEAPAHKVTIDTGAGSAAEDNAINIDSKDILDRKEGAGDVFVKHVLIAWKDLDSKVYNGRIDKRAAERSNADAAKLAQEIADKLRKNPASIDEVVKQYSEDPGSKDTGEPYEVKADAPFVPEFKALALHLKENEVGIVKTRFGYHVMERVAPPPPDPLETADVLARPAKPGNAYIQWIIIGWKDTALQRSGRGDPRAKDRTKADADKIASDVFAKAKTSNDFKGLMKEFSEDARSKDSGQTMPIEENAPVPPEYDHLKMAALRLNENEAAMIKTPLGWAIIKRVAAPPPPPPPVPDALDSQDILKREPVTQKAIVKHILLNWKDNNGGGDNAKAKARDRATLDKLVKDTVAKLKKGDAIERLMKDLSEDPGSAASGDGYPVTPSAGLVEPFKKLSLRLKPGEVGVVKSDFGIHIIQRCSADDQKPSDPCIKK